MNTNYHAILAEFRSLLAVETEPEYDNPESDHLWIEDFLGDHDSNKARIIIERWVNVYKWPERERGVK